jgi:hypothetical protein
LPPHARPREQLAAAHEPWSERQEARLALRLDESGARTRERRVADDRLAVVTSFATKNAL